MSIKVKVTQNDLKKLQKQLSKIQKLKPALEEIGQALQASTTLRFNTSQDPEGRTWKPSKIVREGKQARTLVSNRIHPDKLQRSIEFAADDREVNVGTNTEYAAAVSGEVGNLPKRQFLGISNLDKQRIDEIIEKHIEK